MREITRICDKAGIVCGTGTASMMPNFFDKWGERDTAFLTYGVGRAAFAGWQAWNLAFGDSVSSQRIAEVERMLRNDFAFKWFAIQRVGGRVVFIMTLKVARKAYNVAPPNSGPAPTPTSDEWLWFQMPSGGTVTLTRTGSPTSVTLEVSLDNGSTWTTWTENGTTRTQTLAAGQVMHVRNASPTSTAFSIDRDNCYTFSFSDTCTANGNTNSLLCSNTANAVLTTNCFCRLYYAALHLTKASELPSEILADRCYYDFCYAATDVEIGPSILPAENLKVYSYYRMFFGTKIKEIKTMMTDITATGCLTSWMYNVPTTGDFWCPQSLTIPTGANGIPTGWTRHDI